MTLYGPLICRGYRHFRAYAAVTAASMAGSAPAASAVRSPPRE